MGGSTQAAINSNGDREKQSNCSRVMVARRGVCTGRIVCVLPPKDKVLEGDLGFLRIAVLACTRRRTTTPTLGRLALHPNFQALLSKVILQAKEKR